MSLQEDFIEFCASKPKDEVIDHSGCWSVCAVGEFHRQGSNEDVYILDFVKALLCNDEGGEGGLVHDTLGNQRRAEKAVPTYGDLHEFLVETFNKETGRFA